MSNEEISTVSLRGPTMSQQHYRFDLVRRPVLKPPCVGEWRTFDNLAGSLIVLGRCFGLRT